MTIDRIHQEIKARWNKVNSNHKKDFPKAYLDDAINKAQDDFVEIFYSGNNSKKYRFGFEVTQQRIDMLNNLVVSQTLPMTLVSTNHYKCDLTTNVPAYRHFLRGTAKLTTCANSFPITITRLNDLDIKLRDANTKPSTMWGRVLGSFSNKSLNVYTDGTLQTVSIDYLKNPIKVFSGGYDSLEFINGDSSAYQSSTSKVQSEIDESFHDILVDMVVQYLSALLENNNKYQIQSDLIQSKI